MASSDKSAPRRALLLDVCALIFIANAVDIREEADVEIGMAANDAVLCVSPSSAWKLALAVSRGRLILAVEPLTFFNDFLARFGAKLSAMSPHVLLHSCALPGALHKESMDRILIATARLGDFVVVLRDRAILDYAEKGHVKAFGC